VVLPSLHAGKRGSSSNELVRQAALVFALAVHLAVSLVGLLWIMPLAFEHDEQRQNGGLKENETPLDPSRRASQSHIQGWVKRNDLPQPQAILN
jgi:hypothetical protein